MSDIGLSMWIIMQLARGVMWIIRQIIGGPVIREAEVTNIAPMEPPPHSPGGWSTPQE